MNPATDVSRHDCLTLFPQDITEDTVVRIVQTDQELMECLAIRRQVFVEEQRLFEESDRDEYDEAAIHLVAIVRGQIVGTVRCYEHRPGLWYGGRLSIAREYRAANIGSLVVLKAVQIMRERADVRRFLANVQIQNVRFFEKLGWRSLGNPRLLKGKKHQLMEIDVLSESQP